MAAAMGSSLPSRAAGTEPPASASHSRAVEFFSSVPMAKTVDMTVKISSIMGMKLGER